MGSAQNVHSDRSRADLDSTLRQQFYSRSFHDEQFAFATAQLTRRYTSTRVFQQDASDDVGSFQDVTQSASGHRSGSQEYSGQHSAPWTNQIETVEVIVGRDVFFPTEATYTSTSVYQLDQRGGERAGATEPATLTDVGALLSGASADLALAGQWRSLRSSGSEWNRDVSAYPRYEGTYYSNTTNVIRQTSTASDHDTPRYDASGTTGGSSTHDRGYSESIANIIDWRFYDNQHSSRAPNSAVGYQIRDNWHWTVWTDGHKQYTYHEDATFSPQGKSGTYTAQLSTGVDHAYLHEYLGREWYEQDGVAIYTNPQTSTGGNSDPPGGYSESGSYGPSSSGSGSGNNSPIGSQTNATNRRQNYGSGTTTITTATIPIPVTEIDSASGATPDQPIAAEGAAESNQGWLSWLATPFKAVRDYFNSSTAHYWTDVDGFRRAPNELTDAIDRGEIPGTAGGHLRNNLPAARDAINSLATQPGTSLTGPLNDPAASAAAMRSAAAGAAKGIVGSAIDSADNVAPKSATGRAAHEVSGAAASGVQNLASQNHHIATNKGKWAGTFEKLFSKVGLSLDDDINKMSLPGHNGRHIDEYHQLVLDRLNEAIAGKTGKAAKQARENELQKLRIELIANPRLPYADGGLR